MLSTRLAIWNYPVILSHQCSTIDSLETYPPPYAIFPSGFLQLLGQLTKVGEVTKEKFLGKCDRLAWNCLKDLPIMTFICNKGILERLLSYSLTTLFFNLFRTLSCYAVLSWHILSYCNRGCKTSKTSCMWNTGCRTEIHPWHSCGMYPFPRRAGLIESFLKFLFWTYHKR